MMIRFVLLLITCLLAGCRPPHAPESATPDSPMLAPINAIVAEQLGVEPADVNPEHTFAAIGADALDLVEIVMEVEDRFDIMIRDEALIRAAGTADANTLGDHLTVQMFATIVEEAPKSSQEERSPVVDDGALRESQVGPFGELSKLANPQGLVLVFVPTFDEVMQIQQRRLGRVLEDVEIEALRHKSVVIALPQEMATKLKQQKSERHAENDEQ